MTGTNRRENTLRHCRMAGASGRGSEHCNIEIFYVHGPEKSGPGLQCFVWSRYSLSGNMYPMDIIKKKPNHSGLTQQPPFMMTKTMVGQRFPIQSHDKTTWFAMPLFSSPLTYKDAMYPILITWTPKKTAMSHKQPSFLQVFNLGKMYMYVQEIHFCTFELRADKHIY